MASAGELTMAPADAAVLKHVDEAVAHAEAELREARAMGEQARVARKGLQARAEVVAEEQG